HPLHDALPQAAEPKRATQKARLLTERRSDKVRRRHREERVQGAGEFGQELHEPRIGLRVLWGDGREFGLRLADILPDPQRRSVAEDDDFWIDREELDSPAGEPQILDDLRTEESADGRAERTSESARNLVG